MEIDIIIRILIIVFSLFVGIRTEEGTPPPPIISEATAMPEGMNMARQPIIIDSVTVNVLESFPMQISLDVKGTIQDGCDFPVLVHTSQDGNSINVEIFRDMPTDVMCPMVIKEYSSVITLDGSFEPGSYTITVNDTVMSVNI